MTLYPNPPQKQIRMVRHDATSGDLGSSIALVIVGSITYLTFAIVMFLTVYNHINNYNDPWHINDVIRQWVMRGTPAGE